MAVNKKLPAEGVEVEFDHDAKTVRGRMLSLPRERAKAVGLNGPVQLEHEEPTAGKVKQFEQFSHHPLMADALQVLVTYLIRTVPDPARSLGAWVATSHTYPRTLFRINVGRTETINGSNVGHGRVHLYVSAEDAGFRRRMKQWERKGVTCDPGSYGIRTVVPLRRITCRNLLVALDLLDDEVILDCAYWLNRALIIKQGDPRRWQDNPLMSESLLMGAWEVGGVKERLTSPGQPKTGKGMPSIPGGWRLVESVARIGQGRFRNALLARFGWSCAITGPQPEQVLEAAHLHPYSDHPEHDVRTGLLLRRDLHALFDKHLLTIDPTTWTVRVAPGLQPYEAIWQLDGKTITVPATLRPDRRVVARHHSQAVKGW